MVFHWSLSDSKCTQVSRTRLKILAVLSNAVVWIVSTRPPTSKSSRPFNSHLVIVPDAPITIGTIVTFMFHYSCEIFSHQRKVKVFQGSLSDSKISQVSSTILCILADLNNAVIWMVSIRSIISKPSSHWTNPSVTVPSTPYTIGITVSFMFYSFFSVLLLDLGTYLSYRNFSVLLCGLLEWSASSLFFVD